MRNGCVMLVVVLAAVVVARDARAQVTASAFAGVHVAGRSAYVDLEDSEGDVGPLYGASFGWRLTRRVTIGVEGAWMPRFLKAGGDLVERGRLTSWMAQADVVIWQGASPAGPQLFVVGGVGVMRSDLADVLGAFTETNTLAAGAVGGGVAIPIRGRIQFRSDGRYVRSAATEGGRAAFEPGHVSFWRVTSGLVVRLR